MVEIVEAYLDDLPWEDIRLAVEVGRCRQPALQVPAHGLAVEPQLPGDGRDRPPLPLQIMDQDDRPESDHRAFPSFFEAAGDEVAEASGIV